MALVLVAGGVLKLRDPRPTRDMLDLFGIPGADVVAHATAAVEVAIGVIAVLFGGEVVAFVIAALYGEFAVMMVLLIRKGDAAQSCGCFGSLSASPSWRHVIINVGMALMAAVAGFAGVRGVVDYRTELDAGGVPQLLAVLAGSALVIGFVTGRWPRPGQRGSS